MTNERFNTTQPSDWKAAWEAQAKAEGVSLAEWIGWCCNANLPSDVAAKLSERGTRGRPPSEQTKSH
ncbi:MAG TPA: hypothetical protein PLR25_29860 [Planctomycetaceae bacterium]|nr:hypothetical protein [Planctomycetaceae bacterium]